MIGLARDTVKVVPYQEIWNESFKKECDLLYSIMGNSALQIEHIGSTSIAGMCAKPIIDLVVVISSLGEGRNWIPKLEAAGYEFRAKNEPPDRIFLAKGEHACRTHHLSLTGAESQFFREKILFRDYLRENHQAFEEYKQLKLRLAEKFAGERASYTDGKAEFVRKILNLAEDKIAKR